MNTAEKLQLEYDRLELRKKELEFKIVEIRNRILAEQMIEEKEQSAAEKWCHDRLSLVRYTPENVFWFTECHEAGQKHGADVERGRYRPLVERAKNTVIALREHKPMHVDGQLLAQALKDLEENEPSRDETDIIGKVELINWNNFCNTQFVRFELPADVEFISGQHYKLTPIKD